MSWFNPSQQQIPTQLLAHFWNSRNGEIIRWVKAGKLMDWDTDNLIGKVKATQARKERTWN